jgi:hypothetical protein
MGPGAPIQSPSPQFHITLGLADAGQRSGTAARFVSRKDPLQYVLHGTTAVFFLDHDSSSIAARNRAICSLRPHPLFQLKGTSSSVIGPAKDREKEVFWESAGPRQRRAVRLRSPARRAARMHAVDALGQDVWDRLNSNPATGHPTWSVPVQKLLPHAAAVEERRSLLASTK